MRSQNSCVLAGAITIALVAGETGDDNVEARGAADDLSGGAGALVAFAADSTRV
jgi:hypothetical protein